MWAGDIPLSIAFWEYAVMYGFLVNSAATLVELALFTSDQVALGLAVHFAPVPYNVLIIVAVWRSAERYEGDRGWAILARASVAIVLPLAIVL